jgi:multidrug efflux system membrane fusion protein
MLRITLWLTVAGLVVAAAAGCQREPKPQGSVDETPVVPVSKPVGRYVTDNVDFTGRTDAVQAVDVRPRVTGYLTRIPFKEGAEVKAGDLLFEIDPRPYQAQLDQATSQVTLNEASLKLARITLQRDMAINAGTPGSIAQQQIDEERAAVEEAVARVNASKASTEVYKLNLSFTKVTAPISGQISRYYLTVGNLANQDSTLLTTVVSLDPMYVYFDMDEPTLLRIRKAINGGTIQRPPDGQFPVLMALQGEERYTHQGTVNFFNNQVNATTGSISVRGVFPNPRPAGRGQAAGLFGLLAPAAGSSLWPEMLTAAGLGELGRTGERILSPGMFVRVRFPIGQPHQALLVIDRAIVSDQGLKYVYVFDKKDNKVQYRSVTTGPLQEDGLRVVEGLKPEDQVVVGNLLQIRPHSEVKPEFIEMPTLAGRPASDAAVDDQSAAGKPKAADKSNR